MRGGGSLPGPAAAPEAATPEVDYELTPPPEAESAAESTAPPTKTYSREEILGALTQLERMSDAEISAIADRSSSSVRLPCRPPLEFRYSLMRRSSVYFSFCF